MMDNLPFIPVYLGYNGMSLGITNFYQTHLAQPNIASRLISLCVSDTLAIDNGVWLAEYLSTYISLRHLSLIDIERSFLELMLNSLPVMNSLVIFNVNFSVYSTVDRVADSFEGIPEGAYYERIFRLFPSLRVCRLLICENVWHHLDCEFVLPSDKTYMPVKSNLLNLRSLTLNSSSSFLSHLLQLLPQLEQLNYTQTGPWLPRDHPLTQKVHNQIIPINKSHAPKLSCLTLTWLTSMHSKSLNELFERDVLFSLMKFRLRTTISDPQVLRNILSMLSSQCLYSFIVRWSVNTAVSRSTTSKILFDTFEKLKGSVPLELELFLKDNEYDILATTSLRRDKYLRVDSYFDENIVHRRSLSLSNQSFSNNRLVYCTKICMSELYDRLNEEFLLYSQQLVTWQLITSLTIWTPFNRHHLHLLFSRASNLRILDLRYRFEWDATLFLKEETLIDLLHDDSLCDILMTNGLRQLNLFTAGIQLDCLYILHSIIKKLPHLEVLEFHDEYHGFLEVEVTQIFMNSLLKLSFLTLVGCSRNAELYERKLHDLKNLITRSFRTEVPRILNNDTIFIWLE